MRENRPINTPEEATTYVMVGRKSTYMNREPLRFTFRLGQAVGVLISDPFEHTSGVRCVEVFRETIGTLSTNCYSKIIPAQEWEGQAIESTKAIIEDLGEVIQELEEHRKRLQDDLVSLEGNQKSDP